MDKAFLQTELDGPWLECTDERLAHDDIEKLDCALLIRYFEEKKNQEYFRLHRPGQAEAEAFPTGTPEEDRQLYETVCAQADLVGFGRYRMAYGYHWSDWNTAVVPLRWRLRQASADAPLFLAADVLWFVPEQQGLVLTRECFTINIQMRSGALVVSKMRYPAKENHPHYIRHWHRGAWTDATTLEIPENISDLAVEALRSSTRQWSGIYPSITWARHGKRAVLAFATHPFDWNITVFRSFLGDAPYKRLFPREQKDNFHPLCTYLGIHPTKSLRRAYAKNPYAVLWYLLLKGWEVEDLNLIQKFYEFDQDFVGIPFSELRWADGAVQIPEENSARVDVPALRHYLYWIRRNKNEHAMTSELYRLQQKGITQEQMDTLQQFAQYEERLPLPLRWRLLKHGLTREVHDLISEAVMDLQTGLRNVEIAYTPEEEALEYQIGAYEFRLVRQTRELLRIGGEMRNCVAGYRTKVLRKESIIMTARTEDGYAICIELDGRHRLLQAYGPLNHPLSGDALLACRTWVAQCGLPVAFGRLAPADLSAAEDWDVRPLHPELLDGVSPE